MRGPSVIKADAKQTQALGASLSIPKRILYIDSEGWFITASDQYSKDGALWKTLAIFTGLALSCAPARSFFRLLLFEARRSHAAPGDGRSRPRAPLRHFQPGLLAGLLRQAGVAANSVGGVR